jgi:Mg2+ and Co2+ transporter CorA
MTLEERVAALEAQVQEIKHTHAARVDAFAAAQHHLYEQLLAFQSRTLDLFGDVTDRFDRVDERFAAVDERFAEVRDELGDVKSTLLVILDRLPRPPAP